MKKFGVEWAQPASKDLGNITDYISQDNVDTAIVIFEKIKSKCNTLNQFKPTDGYYKLDVYLYYALTFVLPLVVGWRKKYENNSANRPGVIRS